MESLKKVKKRTISRSCSGGSSSNKFFRCFKSAVDDDDDGSNDGGSGRRPSARDGRGELQPDEPDEPFLAYVAVKERDGIVLRKIWTPADEEKVDDPDSSHRKQSAIKKMKGYRIFSRVAKAVFFETSLAKKFQKGKKSPRESIIINASSKAERIMELMDRNCLKSASEEDKHARTDSDLSTSSSLFSIATTATAAATANASLSLSSLHSSPSRMGTFKSKQLQLTARVNGCSSPSSPKNSGLCLLLLTLMVLVFWGKTCAILCTSTWLLFVMPRWAGSTKYTSRVGGEDSPDADSAENKKRIIMEGLLQRERCRLPPTAPVCRV